MKVELEPIPPPPIPVKKRKKPKIPKVRVFAAETVELQPGTGYNIGIDHKPLPAGKSYLFTLFLMMDAESGKWVSAPRALVSDDVSRIPISNLGEVPVKVLKNRLLGVLEVVDENHIGVTVTYDAYLASVFDGDMDEDVGDLGQPEKPRFGNDMKEYEGKE
ncbi:hypothetical protein B0A52_06738 [Exophiala mesophila]|uniref:Uncharacterized protein n=1 Tax=Exophiala mesophila TaxID=212818 RepID=A0A438N202_EXOME|nr:hypothetical protein B0A52_06738 [Exophiala mesophila]